MFKKMLEWLRKTLDTYFNIRGSSDIMLSSDMESKIAEWANMYENKFDKKDGIACSVGLPASIAAELARLVTMEYEMTVGGSARAEYIDTLLKDMELPIITELACAIGGIVLKPYVSGGRVVIDTVQGDCFYPTTFDTTGRMTGAIFVDQISRNNKIYTRLERHEYVSMVHTVENKAFVSNNNVSVGNEIALSEIPEWADIVPSVSIPSCTQPLFAYFKMPFANTIDRHSPLGVSVYSRAEALIADADSQYGRYLWEFEGGELAIDTSSDYLREKPGATDEFTIPKGKKRLFRGHDVGNMGSNFYEVFSPAFRDEAIKRGFNTMLQRIEFNCGLAYGTLSDPQNVDKTAEEVRSSKQRSYSTVKSIQRSAERAITDLVYAIDRLISMYNLYPQGAYTIAFDWDDSIINDPTARKQMFWSYVVAGKFPAWRYYMEFEGYTEEDARAIQAEASKDLGDPYADTTVS